MGDKAGAQRDEASARSVLVGGLVKTQRTNDCVTCQVVPSDKGEGLTGRAAAILFYTGWRGKAFLIRWQSSHEGRSQADISGNRMPRGGGVAGTEAGVCKAGSRESEARIERVCGWGLGRWE